MEESPIFKISGDHHDMSKPWKDECYRILRDNGVASFVAAVGLPIIWNLHAQTAAIEKSGIRKSISSFIALSGSETVRKVLRQVESNTVHGIDLTEDVDKLRYIVVYYDAITAPNDFKDGDIDMKIRTLSYISTGHANIYDDVVTYFDKFSSYQDELQIHAKMSEYQMKSTCATELSKAHDSIFHLVNMSKIRNAAYSFEDMMAEVKEVALNIKQNKAQGSTYSANTTVEKGSVERQMQEILSQRNFEDRDYAHESSVNSFERGHRRRSDSRGRYPDSGHSGKTSFSRNDRAPYSSSSYTQRGRSPSADRYTSRYSSNSYGTPQNQRRSVSRDRSRSRDRNNSRSNFSRSSNSSVRSYRESEIIEEAARILQRSGRRN